MKILKAIFLTSLSFSILAKEPTLLGDESLKNGEATNYTIDRVVVNEDARGFVYFTQALGGTRPPCVVPGLDRVLVFDLKKEGGKAIYSMVLTAQVSGKKISAQGTGNCLIHSQAESWYRGWITD